MPPAVCLACEAEVFACAILHTETFVNSNVLVVFEYEHFVRELIVRAKTKNDIVAMGFILKFMGHCAQDVVRNYDVSSTLVVPAPPSFWGRVRGRFDLAQMASLALFSRADVFTGARRVIASPSQFHNLAHQAGLQLLPLTVSANFGLEWESPKKSLDDRRQKMLLETSKPNQGAVPKKVEFLRSPCEQPLFQTPIP